jgi:hypothetical protein
MMKKMDRDSFTRRRRHRVLFFYGGETKFHVYSKNKLHPKRCVKTDNI